ncbi:MAG: carboxypeptidase-like regulatory domain-containing protein [Tannerella sp.]|jgi:hypothetical protein|nr:carboxypeptidase-like regulatory domain-containing protein [Tannerella sp.]
MKAKRSVLPVYLALFLWGNGLAIHAQEEADAGDFYVTAGIVKDVRTKKPVEYVNVSAPGTHVGTVTNEDGEFTLKIRKELRAKEIRLSCIGYYNAVISVTENNREEEVRTFFMTPDSYSLSEIQVFSWKNPRDLIRAALDRVENNYVMKPNMLTGFYRETIQKRRRYITISEAVVDLYKGPYNQPAGLDRVRVLKGRKLISPKMADTLSVKLQGGPNMAVYMDLVKNPDLLLDREVIQYYTYKMGETTSIDDRLQYVVHFEPQMILPYPLYRGTFYIDRETLSFTRAEFKMDLRDRQKVISAILIEKPRGLRFTPEEVSYIVTYKYQGDKAYLNYIRNDIKFRCDWKRRLFTTGYTVSGETVITDRDERNVTRIPAREAFSIRKSLSQEVALYRDENFWGNYNIIEPTESLESAVNKLRKQHLKSQ